MSEFAKTQLREHLASLLIPCISQGFWSVHDTAQKLCERNKQPTEILRTFQNMLTKIPEWSEQTLLDEVERITKVSKCTYIDDLLLGVFLAYMKSFAALQYRGQSNQIKVEFDRPNVSKFIHELYKHSARKLWQAAYLFKMDVSSEQQAKNRNEIELVIYKSIDDVVRAFLPWETIAKSYFTESPQSMIEEAPKSKSVIFEDIEDEEDDNNIEDDNESEEDDEEFSKSINLTEEDDKVSITDLDEKVSEQTIEVPMLEEELIVKEKNPLDEIDSKLENDETLVLNL